MMSSEGHKLGREIIAKHGVDRFPAVSSNYRHLLDEIGELGEALMLWHESQGLDPEIAARVRKEYGDAGLTLYTLGDKLLLDLDECMREVVAGETRRFTSDHALCPAAPLQAGPAVHVRLLRAPVRLSWLV
jgi:hypothetical protein